MTRVMDVAEVRAEMAANVWKVVATEGQQVADGDTLIILESMKMEIPVVAESDGVVSQLVAEGVNVQEGDILAVISCPVGPVCPVRVVHPSGRMRPASA